METNREAIERLKQELVDLRVGMTQTLLAIQNIVTALDALHGYDKTHVSPHDEQVGVDTNDLLAWTNLLYIAKHFSLNLRRENDLWYMGIHNRQYAHTWNSYEDIGILLGQVRREAQKYESH